MNIGRFFFVDYVKGNNLSIFLDKSFPSLRYARMQCLLSSDIL